MVQIKRPRMHHCLNVDGTKTITLTENKKGNPKLKFIVKSFEYNSYFGNVFIIKIWKGHWTTSTKT